MARRRFRFLLSLVMLLATGFAAAQKAPSSDDIQQSLRSCKVMEASVSHERAMVQQEGKGPGPDNDFITSAPACERLRLAVAKSDEQEARSAAASLRPVLALHGMAPSTPHEQLAALEEKAAGASGMERFDELPQLAKRAMLAGETGKAETYAKELLQIAPQYPKSWNYGNAIFYGNLVLGHVASQSGNLQQAGQYLLTAGGTPGSPQLNSFGPNMTLAKELLEKGQSEVVLRYFELCRDFWKMDFGKLDEWSASVRRGEMPKFSANLVY